MSGWAKVGAKCVCVDAGVARSGDALIEGRVYTVSSFIGERDCEGNLGLLLKEATSDHPTGAYKLRRFRPLITQQDDVALFQHLLTGTPVRESEPC